MRQRQLRKWITSVKVYLLTFSLALGATSNVRAQRDRFTTIDFPGASNTQVWGINPRGEITGDYTLADGTTHGFLLSGDDFTTIDFPGASVTSPGEINPRGDIVGLYVSAGLSHGFLLSGRFHHD